MIAFVPHTCFMSVVRGHGRLVDPPGRASMWRYGYDTPIDYNDNQLFCGGFDVQHFQNDGKCGICGDQYGKPQLNQPPGIYAKGIITRNYTMNSNVTMRFEITASHKGFLQFRICPNNDVTKAATQECLDKYVLTDSKTGGTKFYFNWETVGIYDAHVSLPTGLTCSQCVVQWKYKTGNSWGCVNDDASVPENCAIGLGRQEEFYSCADVAILSQDGSLQTTVEPQSSSSTSQRSTSSLSSSATSSISSTMSPVSFQSTSSTSISSVSNECKAVGIYEGNPNIDWWCVINCPGVYCSSAFCSVACNQTSITTSTDNLPVSTLASSTQQTITIASTTDLSSTTPQTTKTDSVTTIPGISSTVPVPSPVCPPRNTHANSQSVIEWCKRSCTLGYCPLLLCDCSSFSVPSTTTSSFMSTKFTTKTSTESSTNPFTTSTLSSTTETPPSTKLTCVGAGAFRNDTAVAAWCNTNCKLDNCPPNTCQCSRDGTLTEFSYGIGDRCVTVMQNISAEYKLYMDLWCKHNCPRFNCRLIPDVCHC